MSHTVFYIIITLYAIKIHRDFKINFQYHKSLHSKSELMKKGRGYDKIKFDFTLSISTNTFTAPQDQENMSYISSLW